MAGDDSGFKETTEGVKSKLEIEIPEQALTTLTALSKQMENYRIQMEAASRAQGDHKGYLEQMPQIADLATTRLKEWCDQVERAVDLKGKLGDLSGIPGAVGQDSANPFGSGVLGRGDIAGLMSPLAASNPDAIVSMANQRGMINREQISGGLNNDQVKELANLLSGAVGGETPNDGGSGKRPDTPGGGKKHSPQEDEGTSPVHKMEEGLLKSRDLAGNVLGEIGPGKSWGDMLGAGRDVLGGLEGAGGMVGKVAGALGPVGAGVGLALTANQLMQMGGERLQDYRNLGSTTGGGIREGMEYDAKAKMLALDPFITTAQAREVIQGSLNAGMGGDSFDSVTGFIAKNLKDMNLQVADSVKLLQTNVEEGGMSIDQLGASLSNVNAIAKDSAKSQGQLMQDFGANTAALTNIGVSGPQGTIATQFMGMFNDSPLLSSVGGQILQQGLQNPVFQSSIANQAGMGGGLTPDVAMQKLANSGQLPQAVLSRLTELARKAQNAHPDPDMQVKAFQQYCQATGFTLDFNTARGLYQQLIQPGGMQAALGQADAATKGNLEPEDRSFAESSMHGLEALGSQVANFAGGALGMVAGVLDGSSEEKFRAMKDRSGEIDRRHEAQSGVYSNAVLDQAVEQYGTDNLQVTDAQGKNAQKLDQANKEQRDKLAAGELLIAARGGTPQKLSAFGAGDTPGGGGATNVNVSAQPLTVRYEGPISGPSAVPLTANQMQANSGSNNATHNNPPKGDR